MPNRQRRVGVRGIISVHFADLVAANNHDPEQQEVATGIAHFQV